MNTTYAELTTLACNQLYNGGAFLLAGKEERNPMTIGWCQFGRLWNQPVCTVYVRHSRFSHALIERDGLFTLAFPQDEAMKQALAFCGSNSGRDVQKREKLGLELLESRGGGIDTLKGNFVHFECRVIGKAEFLNNLVFLEDAIPAKFYNAEKEAGNTGDMHTVYYGDILAAYNIK